MITKFNLLTEPWIPAVSVDDRVDNYSLLEIFDQATKLRRILGDVPTQEFAILRICLAVVHRAVAGPKTEDRWFDLWEEGIPPFDEIKAYLEGYQDRFYLLHPTAPFMQVADLHTEKGVVSDLTKLIIDVPSGHQYFTMRSAEGLASISFEEAARWVIHAQAFDPSGIKTGVVGDPRVRGGRGYPIGTAWGGAIGGLFVEGATLWETLLLNLIPEDQPHLINHTTQDRPAWEAPPNTSAQAEDIDQRPYGPLDLFTWQARRIRLFATEESVTGVLLANGDKIEAVNRHREEPMTAWRAVQPRGRGASSSPVEYRPRLHDPTRRLWRGLGQLLPIAAGGQSDKGGAEASTAAVIEWAADVLGEEDRYVNLRGLGLQYGTHNSVAADLINEELTLSINVLSTRSKEIPELLIQAVANTEDAVGALRNLAANLVYASGGDVDFANAARERAAEDAYAAIDPLIRGWIKSLSAQIDIEAERFRWHGLLKSLLSGLGAEMVEAAGESAWVGRSLNGRRITAPESAMWFERALGKALPTRSGQEEVVA